MHRHAGPGRHVYLLEYGSHVAGGAMSTQTYVGLNKACVTEAWCEDQETGERSRPNEGFARVLAAAEGGSALLPLTRRHGCWQAGGGDQDIPGGRDDSEDSVLPATGLSSLLQVSVLSQGMQALRLAALARRACNERMLAVIVLPRKT